MDFSIGNEIKKMVRLRRMKNAEFAEKMSMEERNLYHFFKKSELTLDQLLDASRILDHDFVNLYIKNKKNAPHITADLSPDLSEDGHIKEAKGDYVKVYEPEISFSVNLYGELGKVKEAMPDMLTLISEAAEERGLRLG